MNVEWDILAIPPLHSQELAVTKEEGQSLIHAAHTWGEKAQSGSNADGREVIKTELASLQRDWDKYITSISDTKSSLEVSLLQVRFLNCHSQFVVTTNLQS